MTEEQLKASVVLLKSAAPGNSTIGTGFFVAHEPEQSRSWLITCAHVVEKAGEQLKIDNFPECTVKKHVLGSKETIDLALLTVSPPCKVPVLPTKFDAISAGQSFITCGYTPFSGSPGQHISGLLRGEFKAWRGIRAPDIVPTIDAWDLTINQNQAPELANGYSGSPLCDEQGRVFAVVSHGGGERGLGNQLSNFRHLPGLNTEDFPWLPEITKATAQAQPLSREETISWTHYINRDVQIDRLAHILLNSRKTGLTFSVLSARANDIPNYFIYRLQRGEAEYRTKHSDVLMSCIHHHINLKVDSFDDIKANLRGQLLTDSVELDEIMAALNATESPRLIYSLLNLENGHIQPKQHNLLNQWLEYWEKVEEQLQSAPLLHPVLVLLCLVADEHDSSVPQSSLFNKLFGKKPQVLTVEQWRKKWLAKADETNLYLDLKKLDDIEHIHVEEWITALGNIDPNRQLLVNDTKNELHLQMENAMPLKDFVNKALFKLPMFEDS